MALIACSECGRQISTQAPSCPGCGAPPRSGQAATPTATPAPGDFDPNRVLWSTAPSQAQNTGNLIWCLLLCASIVLAPLGILIWLVGRMKLSSTHYTLTPMRLTVKSGIFSKKIDDIALFRIKDTEMRQSFWQRIGGVGSIVIISADSTDPVAVLEGISKPDEVRKLLRDQADLSRRREGVRTVLI